MALHGRPAHVAALAAALTDDNVWVVKGAVRALGNPAMKTDPALLQPLLATQDRTLRLEVATSLARLGAPAGGAALDRLASENEADLRRQAARAMGETRDRQFTATLIRLLDDVLSVRAAALEALPLVVGRDVAAENNTGRATSDLAHRVAAWKTWWQQEQAQSR